MQASKPKETKTQLDTEGFIPVPKTKNPTHKKIIKETHVQNPTTTNPFISLAQEDTHQKPTS